MFFNSRGVVDNICYGKMDENGAYYLIYDDIDAGMDYEAIRVTKATYQRVVGALEYNWELTGTLVGSREYETIVYELHTED